MNEKHITWETNFIIPFIFGTFFWWAYFQVLYITVSLQEYKEIFTITTCPGLDSHEAARLWQHFT